MSTASSTVTLEGRFAMHRGGFLERPTIAYETWGELKGTGDNAILVFTGLSPSAHAASSALDPAPGWWESMIGEDRPIDTRRWHVVCVNSLGSPFGSSSPVSIDAATGMDEDVARCLLDFAGTLPLEELRAAGELGPEVGLPSDATCADRLLALTGRRP